MYLTKETFQQNLNSRFWLTAEAAEPYAVDLVEVADGLLHAEAGAVLAALSWRPCQYLSAADLCGEARFNWGVRVIPGPGRA